MRGEELLAAADRIAESAKVRADSLCYRVLCSCSFLSLFVACRCWPTLDGMLPPGLDPGGESVARVERLEKEVEALRRQAEAAQQYLAELKSKS